MLNDLRHAGRVLRGAPLLSLAVILTVTLSIGATTAIFSVVNAVMLRPLPFANPDRLVWVAERNDKLNLPTFSASTLNYQSWKERAHAFDELGAIGFGSFNLSGQGDPEQLAGSTVTASVFPILGVPPAAGRAFREGEDKPGAAPVVMISEALWRRRFGGDRALVGKRLTLNGLDYEVIGVAPDAIRVLSPADVWVPLIVDPARERRLNHLVTAIGGLKAGVTIEQAQSDMDAVSAGVGAEYPEVKDWGIRLVSFSRWIIGDQLRTSLLVLFGAVACVLVIACANVANLLLSRAVSREKEMATRTALGASRARLVRQLLVESLTLSTIGGALGLVAAYFAVRIMNSRLPQGLLPTADVHIDAAVLIFASGVTMATGLLFGLAPAWSMAKTELHAVLKQSGRSSTGGGRALMRNGLAAAELALATMLVVGAGLLAQTLVQLQHVRLGFQPDHLLTFQISLPQAAYPPDSKALVFYKNLLESLQGVPGVTSAAVSSGVPFGQGNYTTTPVKTIGQSVLPPDTAIPIDWRIVSPNFFATLDIPLVRGRTFTDTDGTPGTSVTVVSEATASRFWGTADPIGRVIRRVADGKDFSVVGVVGEVKNAALNQDTPTFYYSSASRVWPRMDIVIRTAQDPASVLTGARERVRALDRDVPISNVRTMEEWLDAGAAQPRLNAVLLGVFAGVALLVAAVGVYGVLAYSVNQRTREIGLRMALGAPRSQVLGLFVREGMTVGLAGIAIGVAGALGLSRVLGSLVFGVPVRDPLTFLVAGGVLVLVALAACVVPARRASRVDPLVALRAE